MNRFFKTTAEQYEQIRQAMDLSFGYPNEQADTWFCPASQAPKDIEENCLIAAIALIAEEFVKAGAEEITEEQYNSLIDDKEL